jgi:hypothetical protein
MNYQVSPKADTSGTSFQMYLCAASVEQMTKAFGAPSADAYWDPERGYDGDEWQFESDSGLVFNVYARWGQLRVGAHGEEGVEAFGAWLYEKLGINAVPALAAYWVSPIGSVVPLRGGS